jgi:hypothetical protein
VVGRPEGPYRWPFTVRAGVVSMSRFRGTLLPAATLVLVLTTGCGGLSKGRLDPTASGTSAGVTSSPGTETATDPRTEGSVTSTSGRAQTQQVAVKVPKLPVGGNGQGVEFEQCVSVSYLGDEPIPPDVALAVTGASLDAPFLKLGGSACSADEVLCLASDFAFVANPDSTGDTCFIPVQGTGERPDQEDEENDNVIDERVVLSLDGLAVCSPGEQALCEEFAASAFADAQTIPLDVRLVESSSSSSSSTSTSTSTQESSSSGETSAPPD